MRMSKQDYLLATAVAVEVAVLPQLPLARALYLG